MRFSSHTLLICLLGLFALPAQALTVGQPKLQSHLGEPLYIRVPVAALDGLDENNLKIRIADEAAYKKMNVVRDYRHTGFRLEFHSPPNSELGVIEIRSRQPYNDPYLDMVLQLEWPTGEMYKTITVLLDPPR